MSEPERREPSASRDRAGPTDQELWSRIRSGDADAFRLLFDRHGPRIHRFATRRTGDPGTADDITAMVFLEAWRRRGAVDLVHESAGPWLYGVANNVLRHRHRSRRHHAAALERLAALPRPRPSSPTDRSRPRPTPLRSSSRSGASRPASATCSSCRSGRG